MRPHGLQPTRFLYPWNYPGKNTGLPFPPPEDPPNPRINLFSPVLLHGQADSLPLGYLGSQFPIYCPLETPSETEWSGLKQMFKNANKRTRWALEVFTEHTLVWPVRLGFSKEDSLGSSRSLLHRLLDSHKHVH